MGILSTVKSAMPTMFRIGAEDATYTPAGGVTIDCKVFIDFDVQFQPSGMEAQVWKRGTTIEALLSEAEGGIGLTEPNRGDVFVYDGTSYKVSSVMSNDGLTVKMVVT